MDSKEGDKRGRDANIDHRGQDLKGKLTNPVERKVEVQIRLAELEPDGVAIAQPEAIGKDEVKAALGKVKSRPRNSRKASTAHANGRTGWEA